MPKNERLRSDVWSWARAVNSAPSPFSATEKHVLVTLAQYMSPAGDSCYPSMETLAGDSSRALSTVRDAIGKAQRWGWVQREIRRGRGHSNRYLATVPAYFNQDATAEENRRAAVGFEEALREAASAQGSEAPEGENHRSPVVLSGAENRRRAVVKPPESGRKTAGVRRLPIQDQSKDLPQQQIHESISNSEKKIGGRKSAAAEVGQPVSLEQAVAELATLTGWDSGSVKVVMPLAQQLPQELFAQTLAKVRARNATNPPGLLVHLLGVAIADWRREQNQARLDTWDEFFGEAGLERVKRDDPDRYVLAWATPALEAARPLPPALVVEHVLDYVWSYTGDNTERERLLGVFLEATDRIPSIRAAHDWVLVAIDRNGHDLDEVLAFIDSFMAGSPQVDVDELRAFAREVAANVERDNHRRVA